MSEEAKDTKEAKPKEKKKTPAQDFSAKAETKKAWTAERCMKAARRFKDETSWSSGAPSSYKSAQAHGWTQQCLSVMSGGKATTGKKLPRSA